MDKNLHDIFVSKILFQVYSIYFNNFVSRVNIICGYKNIIDWRSTTKSLLMNFVINCNKFNELARDACNLYIRDIFLLLQISIIEIYNVKNHQTCLAGIKKSI